MTTDTTTLDRLQQLEAAALAAYTARPYILTEVAYEKARQDAEFAELAYATATADTAQPAPVQHTDHPVTVRRTKAPKFPRGVPTGLTCSATPCEHTVYEAEDPHCRRPGCPGFIDTCITHIRPKAAAKLGWSV